MPKIYLSPSDQTNNAYAYGNTTEAEQCRLIAKHCAEALTRCGFDVKCNTTSGMEAKVRESNSWGADIHIPIHTNACNGNVTGTRIFYGAYKTPALAVYNVLAPFTPGTSDNISQHNGLYEINNVNAMTIYVEAEFHDVPAMAKWIIENTSNIGEKIAEGVCAIYGVKYVDKKDEIPDGWTFEDGNWCYYLDGQKIRNEWAQDSVDWCYLGNDGYLLTNAWVQDRTGWCYVGNDGRILRNAIIDNYHIDEEGHREEKSINMEDTNNNDKKEEENVPTINIDDNTNSKWNRIIEIIKKILELILKEIDKLK